MGTVPSKPGPARPVRRDTSAVVLLAVIVLAAILTVLAIPLYRSYTLHTHNRLAEGVLEDALRRETTRQGAEPGKRLLSLESLGYPSAAIYLSSDGSLHDGANASSIYRISLSFPSAADPESCGLLPPDPKSGFVLVALPIQMQKIDTLCATLCLSSAGERAATGTAGADQCWRQGAKR